ncbi:biotin--[acetyl-CoA-carboxylase] ligase [Glaciibacter psychrotolerans]|uniref:biotin--[biotin carboxyl-carrier protein] ligase n=1 Tax=Glaciibacter psychrotolerans TaxID=670054 RepID=A0A7Z0EEN5_9MICO|nr:biotin--[acetyl-CoA-carboxylase] ligase [Leifsonia psychrotolerans]NYJ20274.1 BirA family biotin operon repressor/biotin-[acetyl-CoA-carboxylase] ligase [Leifsonia psychrotolerans]
MQFEVSRETVSRFEYLAEAGSTNDVLVAAATGMDADTWPHLSVVVTDNQTSGRGRLGRTWLAPTGKSLAISVLLRTEALTGDTLGWIPLLAGAAMTRAVRSVVGESLEAQRVAQSALNDTLREVENPVHDVSLKWPNDVLIDGYKVSGILCELLPGATGVVIGAGLNVSLDEHDLPTLTSTSLLLVTQRPVDPDDVLARYLRELSGLVNAFLAADGDAQQSGLFAAVTEVCGTLGTVVRVELPGGDSLVGTATALDPQGRLVVIDQTTGESRPVAAGDVTHLRY